MDEIRLNDIDSKIQDKYLARLVKDYCLIRNNIAIKQKQFATVTPDSEEELQLLLEINELVNRLPSVIL